MDKSTREKTYQEELEIFYEYYLPQVEKLKNETSEPTAIHCANATTYRITRKMLVEIDKLRNQNAELIVENEALRIAGDFLKMHKEENQ